ncbi:MAG: MBL fold metallo-hydrolase [Anaerolineae bacterium]
MPAVIVLGTAASVPNGQHDTVGLALRSPEGAVLIDCGGSPLHKLARHGIDMAELQAIILTHGHADHLYGLPMLVQGLWLGGREAALPVYGPAQALDRARRLLEVFELADREGLFALEWHAVPLREGRRVLSLGSVQVTTTPVVHGDNDTIGLRFDDTDTGGSAVYSSDTEPCDSLIRLAAGADLLLHEATGNYAGHSSPQDAAEVAREAGVGRLALIHYPVRGVDPGQWCRRATGFSGQVFLAKDGDVYPLQPD